MALVAIKTLTGKYFTGYRNDFVVIFLSKIVIALISFVTTPILARLFMPSDYGLFALINSLVITLSLLTNLTLPAALVVMDGSRPAITVNAIFGYAVISNLVFLVFGLVIAGFADDVIFFDILTVSPQVIVLISLASLLLTVTQVLANLNIREKAFKKNVAVNLMDNISIRVSALALGLAGMTKYGLFYAEIIGKAVNALRQLSTGTMRFSISPGSVLNLAAIRSTIRMNTDYPLYNLPVTLLNNFNLQIVIWLIAFFFTKQYVGYLTMSLGLLSIPLLLISNSLQPLVTRKLVDDRSTKFFTNLSAKFFLAGLVIYSAIFLLAPWLVALYLGDEWLACVTIVQILAVPYVFLFHGSAFSGAFIVLNKQRAALVIKVFFLILLLITLNFALANSQELETMTAVYAAVISAEEITKILYLGIILKNVRSSSVLR